MTKDEFFKKAGEKFDNAKRSVVNGVRSTAQWVSYNPLVSIAILSVGARAVEGVYGAIQQAKKEARMEEARLTEWDPKTMTRVKRTRELTAEEKVMVDNLKGEIPLSEIYARLGVLADDQ